MHVACEGLGVSKRCAQTVGSLGAKKWKSLMLVSKSNSIVGTFLFTKM
jgi:hypothetical protein